MASIGEWLNKLPPARAAFGFILLIGSLILTVTTSIWTNIGIPARTTSLEAAVDAMDQTLTEHIAKEEQSTARIYCVVKEVFDYMVDEEKEPINPLACDQEGGES